MSMTIKAPFHLHSTLTIPCGAHNVYHSTRNNDMMVPTSEDKGVMICMKQKVWVLLLLLPVWLYSAASGTAFAHVALEGSLPEDGATVTEPVDSIALTFSGDILPMSTLTIIDESGAETAPLETVIEEGNITAKLAAPLPHGAYEAKWNIVAQDGHHLEGSIGFTVAAEAEEPQELQPEPELEPGVDSEEPAANDEPVDDPATTAEVPSEPGKQGQSTAYVPYIAAAAVVILGALLFLLLRPKRKS